MNCNTVRPLLWSFTASELDEDRKLAIANHLFDCNQCELERRRVRSLSAGLRNLPQRPVPPILTTRLRVAASHQKEGRLPGRFDAFRTRVGLAFDHLLKPLAVPAAGGLMASFLCFGVIVDTLQYRPDLRPDMPVGLFTQISISEPSPFSCAGKDVIVQLAIDANGKVTDYTLPRDGVSPEQLQEIGNLILYSTFSPAVSFGQRVPGRILVDIHHVDVRG